MGTPDMQLTAHLVLALAVALALLLAGSVVHELGHLLAALLAGVRKPIEFGLGSVARDEVARRQISGLIFVLHKGVGGYVNFDTRELKGRWPEAGFILGGPVLGLAYGVLLYRLPAIIQLPSPLQASIGGYSAFALLVGGAISIALNLVNLIPRKPLDGYQLLCVVRGQGLVEKEAFAALQARPWWRRIHWIEPVVMFGGTALLLSLAGIGPW